jgi:hypothetical protein
MRIINQVNPDILENTLLRIKVGLTADLSLKKEAGLGRRRNQRKD